MTDNQELWSIAFAALLHDVGKFTYRAIDVNSGDKRNDHETLGGAFIQNHIAKSLAFKEKSFVTRLIDYSKRGNASVHGADCASASERLGEAMSSLKTLRPLESVLSKVNIGKGITENANNCIRYFAPYNGSVNVSTNYKPREYKVSDARNWKLDKSLENELIKLNSASYKQFTAEVDLLGQIRDLRSYFTSFYYIFERYGSRICSAGYASRPDISLFDHSRNVAALALCRHLRKNASDDDCILLTGDFTGIQNFIYSDVLGLESASKTLRGRSFFVRLLSDAVIAYILRELKLFETNILMNSGGHFILILPNTAEMSRKLIEIEAYLNSFLFDNYLGKISLVLASLTCKSEEFHRFDRKVGKYEFKSKLKELNQKLNINKKRKNLSILDQIVGKSYSGNKENLTNKDQFFAEIGGDLPKSDYLLEIHSTMQQIPNTILANKSQNDLGIYYKLLPGGELGAYLEELDEYDEIERIVIYSLDKSNNDQYIKNLSHYIGLTKHNIALGFKYDGSYIPLKQNNVPYSFEELAKPRDSQKDTYSMLGALRMDVDDLGTIFIKGLSEEDYSISKYAALSREMNNFFMEYLPELAKQKSIYLVYAGGDDLFAVGNWENIIDFAHLVRNELNEFSGSNPNITISGGIVTVKPGFPISRFAKAAEVEEDKSKDINKYYENHLNKEFKTGDTKNAISVFGRSVKWDTFEQMSKIKDMLQDIIRPSNDMPMPLSFIHFLLTETQRVFDKNGKFQIDRVHRVTAKMHYMYARKGINQKAIESFDAKQIDDQIKNYKIALAKCFMGKGEHKDPNLLVQWYHNFKIPASYIIYKNREKK